MHNSATVQAWLGYLFVEEIEELKRLANLLPQDPVVINIGAGGGTSGLTFKESRPDLTLITVDIQEESSPFGCLQGERIVMTDAGYKLGDQWRQVHGDSKKVGKNWNGDVDMVFIDGEHSYIGCKGDIKAWLPHLKSGGIIAVHDYRKQFLYEEKSKDKRPNHPAWPGVDRAVDEFLLNKYKQLSLVKSLIAFEV